MSRRSKAKKRVIIGLIIGLFILLVLLIGALFIYANSIKDYKNACVPIEKYNECNSTSTKAQELLNKYKENQSILQVEKEVLEDELNKSNTKLNTTLNNLSNLTDSYRNLLDLYSELNQTYYKLLEDYDKLKEEFDSYKSEYRLNQITEPTPKGIYFEYSFITTITLFITISLPINLFAKKKKIRWAVNSFILIFAVSMYLLSYIPIFNFWIKLVISLGLALLIAVIVYRKTKEEQ